MRRFTRTPKFGTLVRSALVTTFITLVVGVAQAQVSVGPNVNMGGGPASFTPPSTIIGDPFLQRQNEPSIAVSSRNPCHLLAGANDYRAVDVEEAVGEVGDAWLGVFKSFDCGATWTSTLLPGHKLDATAAGLASPIKGLAAAADATVRAGTSGLFYYSGIAFNRGDGEIGKVFVSRFIDNNNKDGGDPIEYGGTVQIDTGTSGQFLDKPWIVADIPRGGLNCVVNGRSVPAGPVYLAYTSFVGGDNNVRSKIMFARSNDCGATWSNPMKLSERVARNQGTTIAIDPGTGAIHIAWREFAVAGDTGTRNAILTALSTDGGKSFTKAAAIQPGFTPFDQASSVLTFRTNAYPTIAVVPAEAEGRAAGEPGKIYVAWSARGFGGVRPNDARIVISTSIGGSSWTAPRVADSFTDAGHQIMPTMAFAGGKLALAYYDLRDDMSGGFEDLVMEYGQAAYQECIQANPDQPFADTFRCMLTSSSRLTRRHTLDMRAAMAGAECLAKNTCGFDSTSLLGGSDQVSRYREGRGVVDGPRTQLQYNRPNLPIFSRGRFPFIGDYIDIAGQNFVALADGGWAWNTGKTANRPAPVFHVSWADNRNVGSPKPDLNTGTDWTKFTPAVLGPLAVACVPGQVGVRNQDVYTAQLRPGLVVSSPHNSKRVTGLQRSFVVITQNTTDTDRDYMLRATPEAGVIASFSQFAGFGAVDGSGAAVPALTQIVVRIPRKSTISRTLFVGLLTTPTDPNAAPDVLVPVTVDEVVGLTPTGTFDMVYLNPDFENPDFENPDFENAELHNPDFENPDFENPDFENPDFENFTLSASSAIRNPDFENPDFENPDFENPDFENPDFENPDFENPDFENPDFENPDFENPDFENPDFENPDFENGSFEVADTTWPVRNNGNTTSAYKANVYVNNPPDGVKYQLAIRKIFTSPAAVCAVPGSTEAPKTAQSVPVVNIVGPNVTANPFDTDFNDPRRDNATFSLAPGERGIITLRAYCKEGTTACTRGLMASLEGDIALGVIAQGANCARCTGAGCTSTDLVVGATECRLDTGLPKDIYDPIPPTASLLNPTLTSPEATIVVEDRDNTGFENVSFAVAASDNVAVSSVACQSANAAITPASATVGRYNFSGAFPVGTAGVTCTARDLRSPSANATSINFLVVVKNVTPPSFTVADGNPGSPFTPGNPAEATSPAGAVVTYTNPAATDSRGQTLPPASVTCAAGVLQSGSTFPIGTTQINCVAIDGGGLATAPTNLFAINVADNTAPAITIKGSSPMTVEAGGSYMEPGASASDVVDGTRTVTVSGSVDAKVPGTYTITYSASDTRSNTATGTRTVNVVDTTPPVISFAGPEGPVEGNTPGGALVTYTAPASDNVAVVTTTCAPASGSRFPVGITTVNCSATDGANNTGTASGSVTVIDTIAPVVTLRGTASITLEAGTAYIEEGATADDIVSGASVPTTTGMVNERVPATYALTYSAKDGAGNTGTATRTVTVRDTLPPAVSITDLPTTVQGNTLGGANVSFSTSAIDTISGSVTVTCVPASGSRFLLGTTVVNCSATDGSSNTGTAQGSVTVIDTIAPVVTLVGGASVTIEAGTAYSEAGATASDIVSGALVPTINGVVNALLPGNYTLTYSATDGKGNTGTATRTVTVLDRTPPAVSITGLPTTVQGNTRGGANVSFSTSAADTISGSVAVTCEPASGSLFPVGTTPVLCSATDGASNTGTASGSVTVIDTIAPVIALAGSASLTIEAGTAYVDAGATAADIVSGVRPVTQSGAVNTSVLGTYTITYSATDVAGNQGTAVRTITVVDTIAPVVTETASPSTLLWSPNRAMVPVTVSGVVTDATLKTTTFQVVDEYNKVQPSGTVAVAANGTYSFVVSLEAYRNGTDTNGRVYTVYVTATDAAGRSTTVNTVVLVPHNQ